MFSLPTTDGESSILWSHEEDGVAERLRVECSGGDRWTLVSEIREDEDEWTDGPICLDGYRKNWLGLATALRDRTTMACQFMRIMVKGNIKIPFKPKPVKFARMTGTSGWWVAWEHHGERQDGVPFLTISFKRPLDADELVTAIGQMAKAFDRWDKDFGYV